MHAVLGSKHLFPCAFGAACLVTTEILLVSTYVVKDNSLENSLNSAGGCCSML